MSLFSVNKLHEFVAHNTTVNCLTFGPVSTQVVATGGEDCNVNVWRVGNASNIWTLGQNKSPIECLCFDSDEQCIVSGAMNGSLKVFDLNEGKLARSLRGHQVNITALDYHPYGEYIVSGSTDTTMKVWDVRNKTCIQTYTGHEKDITCVKFSPDGRWVASSAKDGQVLFWDLVAGKLMHTVKMGPAYVSNFEFNPQEFLLAATTSMRTVKLWDMENFECIGTSTPEGTPLRALAFTRDGNSLCTASTDMFRVHGWDPVASKGNTMISWDKVTEIRLTDENIALCGSIISNFVSIWTVDIRNALDSGMNGVGLSPPPKVAGGRGTTSSGRNATRGSVNDSKIERRPSNEFNSAPTADEKSPTVTWEAGHNPKDMAHTMSESFDARQRNKLHGAAEKKDSPSSLSRFNDEDGVDEVGSALERMLPPSSFGEERPISTVGVSPLVQRRPAPQIPIGQVGSRDDMRRGPDPLLPSRDAPLAVVGSSHGKRRPGAGPAVSNHSAVAGPRPPTNYSYESIAEDENNKVREDFNTVVERNGRNMLAVLSHRLSSLGILRKHWERGEIDEVIAHLQSLQVMGQHDPKQLIPAADFFAAIELRGHGMNLAACVKILPVLEGMLDGNIECLAFASLRTMVILVEVFGDLIRQTRSVMVAGGVDLSREDRLQKCNACHAVLCRMRTRLDSIRKKYPKSRKFLEVLSQAQNILDDVC